MRVGFYKTYQRHETVWLWPVGKQEVEYWDRLYRIPPSLICFCYGWYHTSFLVSPQNFSEQFLYTCFWLVLCDVIVNFRWVQQVWKGFKWICWDGGLCLLSSLTTLITTLSYHWSSQLRLDTLYSWHWSLNV